MDFEVYDFYGQPTGSRPSGSRQLDRAHLDGNYSDGELWDVTLFLRQPNGAFDVDSPITAALSEQFPIDVDEGGLLKNISHDIERCSWQLYGPCMSRGDDPSWSPSSLEIPVGSVIRVGVSTDWYIVQSVRTMHGTTWRCPSVSRIDSERTLS
ncbi:hypothetical protein [Rhodopirellula halodulae]|uniref:hypothetical protein n=1 Tax=Rhodopirellula halodulae TaxID=2894198 RepID=UPI001E4EEAF7|nr:hypothetical protein [Rhodopirellula sp. JC740]